MREESIAKKMLHKDREENDREEDPNQMDRPNHKGYTNEKIGGKCKKTEIGGIETLKMSL